MEQFIVWLFWKILIGYSQLYIHDEKKQVRNKYAYSILLNKICHVMSLMVSMLSDSCKMRLN